MKNIFIIIDMSRRFFKLISARYFSRRPKFNNKKNLRKLLLIGSVVATTSSFLTYASLIYGAKNNYIPIDKIPKFMRTTRIVDIYIKHDLRNIEYLPYVSDKNKILEKCYPKLDYFNILEN